MALFGRKTSLEVGVDRDRVAPGDRVRVRVTVDEPDKKARDGRVRLVCENTYRYESTDSDGDRTTSTRTHDTVAADEPLFPMVGEPAAGTYHFELLVPAEAPPSAEGAVEWKVVACVDRKGGRDAKDEVVLSVGSAPDSYAQWAERPVAHPNECRMEITANRRAVAPGERIAGTAVLTPASDLTGRGLVARVRGVRSDQDGLSTTYDGPEVRLSDDLELAAGASRSFSFEVEVPADARPSFQAAYNQLHWYLEIVIDRRMRLDPTGRLELVVRTPLQSLTAT